MSKTRLKTFGNDFRLCCNFEKFLIFLKIFDNSTLRGTLSKKSFSEKSPQNTFGHFWERFRAFLQFLKIFDLFENFRRLDPPWNNGQKFFSKNRPKTCSKHVWTLLGTVSGIFENFNDFRFF